MQSLVRFASLLALTSCSTTEVIPEVDPTPYAGGNQCVPSKCGNSNSPMIKGTKFWSVHPGGEENSAGLAIVDAFDAGGNEIYLRTPSPGDRLIGVRADGSGVVQNTGLVNARINMTLDGESYEVKITAVTPSYEMVKFWISNQLVESYTFKYRGTSGNQPTSYTDLCSQEVPGEYSYMRAIVFGRDIYDPTTKDLSFDPSAAGWFNIACEGSAPYKMHMIGYTQAAQNRHAHATSFADRQAMIRTWTGDVCGTGKSFTKHGELITLSEIHDLLPDDSPYIATPTASFEAVWGPSGALCLDVPRLADSVSDIRDQIKAECSLPPPCTSAITGGVVRTGNPLVLVAKPVFKAP